MKIYCNGRYRVRTKTVTNKFTAIFFIFISWLAGVYTNDYTVFIFSIMVGVPLFFSKEKYIG